MFLTTFTNNEPKSSFIPSVVAAFLLSAFILMSFSPQAHANKKYASMVMDADTGLILSERYADKKLHPASLVKMMTLLMAFDALERGDLKLRDRVYVSKHAASMVPSKLNIPVGSSIRVEDAIYALVTKSANDVAVALGEKIGGTESHFAVMMNRKARSIGMRNSHFRNASGLHHPRQISTARDMARLGQYLVHYHPKYYKYFSTQRYTYKGKTYRNHNRLMETYPGMDGLKTGYIQAAGFNLVASAKQKNRRLIGVVFGGRTSRSRNAHMKQLLDRGFKKLDTMVVASAPVPERKPGIGVQIASLEKINTAAGTEAPISYTAQDWAGLDKIMNGQGLNEVIGEGDFDPAVSKRFETGLLAIASVKGYDPSVVTKASLQSAHFAVDNRDDSAWSVQIGAFSSRVKTDLALAQAAGKLPASLIHSKPVIVPLKTEKGLLFRGRLAGMTKKEAIEACRHLRVCLPVSPQAN